jgi:hypothetical protein
MPVLPCRPSRAHNRRRSGRAAVNVREMAAALIASGIDPSKSVLFAQSAVPAHSELAWLLQCTARMGWLNRMTQFKEKSGKNREGASVGLYTYPVLQAADVLLYQATHVPVGEDQKQHIELARDIAIKFNTDFDVELFVPPEPFIGGGTAARVMSLRDGGAKMSKSDPSDMSRINLTDSDDTHRAEDPQGEDRPRPASRQPDRARSKADRRRRIWSASTPLLEWNTSRREAVEAMIVLSPPAAVRRRRTSFGQRASRATAPSRAQAEGRVATPTLHRLSHRSARIDGCHRAIEWPLILGELDRIGLRDGSARPTMPRCSKEEPRRGQGLTISPRRCRAWSRRCSPDFPAIRARQ